MQKYRLTETSLTILSKQNKFSLISSLLNYLYEKVLHPNYYNAFCIIN